MRDKFRDLCIRLYVQGNDMVERAGWTFVQVFAVMMLADGADWTSLALWKSAAMAGVGAALSAVKTALRQRAQAKAEEV